MSVYKRKTSPHYHYDFVIAGRRFHGSTGTPVKEEAKAVEARERRKAALGLRDDDLNRMKLRDAFGRYWEQHAKHKKSADDMFKKMERIIDGLGPDRFLHELTNSEIAAYISKRRGEVADASVNREMTILRAVLHRAKEVWEVPFRMPNWKAHRLIEPRGRIRSLSADEETRLMENLREDFRPLVRFCLITGARVSSARKLTWSQVDEAAGEIRLEVKSKFTGDTLTLPITPSLRILLQEVRGQHPIYVFTYLCCAVKAKKRVAGQRYPFGRDGWRRTWYSALKNAKITDFRFHDLRHTAATQMLRVTGDIAAVQEVLGHKDVATTRRYAHVTKEAKLRAMSRHSPDGTPATTENYVIKIVKSEG